MPVLTVGVPYCPRRKTMLPNSIAFCVSQQCFPIINLSKTGAQTGTYFLAAIFLRHTISDTAEANHPGTFIEGIVAHVLDVILQVISEVSSIVAFSLQAVFDVRRTYYVAWKSKK